MQDKNRSLTLPDPGTVYRVVQWATGRIGASSLKELINSEQFDVVGVYVHSREKEGIDAGELCGLPPTGVSATCDIEAIIALKPDCDIDEDWELLGNGWQVSVDGDTPIKIHVTFPVEPDKLSPAMAALTAYGVINAIPATCAASPGIKRSTALPFMIPKMRQPFST